MNDKKHTYMIMGLLVIVVLLLVMILVEVNKPANQLVDKSSDNIVACREQIAAWNLKYPNQAATNAEARAELSAILDSCSAKVGNYNQ